MMSIASQTSILAESDSAVVSSLPQLLTIRKAITVEAGKTPFTSEDTLRYFYIIVSGKIKISHINLETSKEQTTQLLGRGDMFDVISLLDGRMHEYVATALEKSEIIQIPIEHVKERLTNDPEFNRFFFPYLAKQMRHMESLAVDLSLYDVYHRLLRLIARHIEHTDEGVDLHLINDLSHEELAALIGTVRKVLNRSLQQLKREGIIDVSRKKLMLHDLEALFDALE